MFNQQAQGRGVRARNQAMIRDGGEQGRAAVYGCFVTGATALGLSWKDKLIMSHQDVDSRGSTLVLVENLCFGTRGSFRTELTPRRVAEFALCFLELDFIEAGTVKAWPRPDAEYCDCGSAAVAIVLGPNRVLLRYHAIGDLPEARRWFLANEHLRADGAMGPHVQETGRAVR